MANKWFLNLSFVFVVLLWVDLNYAQDRIVGGQTTTIMRHPYQVALYYKGLFNCGGSLITSNCVLTAAHCVDNRIAKYFKVKAGTNDLDKQGVTAQGKQMRYDTYDRKTMNHDIAIILLNSSIKGENIKYVSLNSDPVNAGTVATVSGWGQTSESNPKIPKILREVSLSVISKENCNKAYPNKLTRSMICAFTKGKDSCFGDSGGPLMDKKQNKQIGITSWGYGCAQPNSPGVYNSVNVEFMWIKKTMMLLGCI